MHLSGRPLAKPYRTRAFFLRIFLPACKKLVVLGHFSFQFELRFFLIWSWSIPVGASKIRCSTRAFAVSKAAVTDHSRHGNAKCEQDSKSVCEQSHMGSNPILSAKKSSHIKAFAHMTGLFFSLKVTSAYMIFGKNSGVPAGLPCVRQSHDIVHYICRGDLKLYTGISHRHLYFIRSVGDIQICDHQIRVQIALFP